MVRLYRLVSSPFCQAVENIFCVQCTDHSKTFLMCLSHQQTVFITYYMMCFDVFIIHLFVDVINTLKKSYCGL